MTPEARLNRHIAEPGQAELMVDLSLLKGAVEWK